MRWRDVGTEEFTWGDCLAITENLSWDDPLTRATRPDDWYWHDPMRDVMVSVVDLLARLDAKTLVPQNVRRSDIPKPIERPWRRRAKDSQQPRAQGRDWDEMEAWVRSRVAAPSDE